MIQIGNGKFEGWRALLMAGILFAGCCALSVPANAQGRGGMGQRGGGIERQLSELTQVLGLSGDQQAQVKGLLEARRAKMEALRAGGAQPSREQMEAIHRDTDANIAALLTDDQKVKFAAWQQQRMEQRRGQGGGAPPAAQPPNI
jgi:Spy/CpxP family protein refolding chaperone